MKFTHWVFEAWFKQWFGQDGKSVPNLRNIVMRLDDLVPLFKSGKTIADMAVTDEGGAIDSTEVSQRIMAREKNKTSLEERRRILARTDKNPAVRKLLGLIDGKEE